MSKSFTYDFVTGFTFTESGLNGPFPRISAANELRIVALSFCYVPPC